MSPERIEGVYKSAAAVLAVCTATAVIGGAVSSWYRLPDRVAKLERRESDFKVMRVQMDWVTDTIATKYGVKPPDLSSFKEDR